MIMLIFAMFRLNIKDKPHERSIHKERLALVIWMASSP